MWWRLPILLGLLYFIVNFPQSKNVVRRQIAKMGDNSHLVRTFCNETGSYYQFVTAPGISWKDAEQRAKSMTFRGRPGHLLTITSPQEDRFLHRSFTNAKNVWIGASDEAAEGQWKWVTGPEAGTLFYEDSVGGTTIGYSAWQSDEPNNMTHGDPQGEDYAMWAYRGRGWNDEANQSQNGRATGFFVEFPGSPQSLAPKNLPPVPADLVQAKSIWRYLDDGSDQKTAWREPDFDDSNWKTGQAELGYGDQNETTRIASGPQPNKKQTTSYFRLEFEPDSLAEIEDLVLSLIRDDGVAVYLNGQEIARDNLAPSARFNQHAQRIIRSADEDVWHLFHVNGKHLVEGKNVLAVEVHQGSWTSTDVSFDLALGTADISALLSALEINRSSTQLEALKIIRRISPTSKEAATALLGKLFDNDSSLVQEAARALGRMGEAGEIALSRLRNLLRHPREEVRVWAAVALLQIDSSLSLESLKQSGLRSNANRKIFKKVADELNNGAWTIVRQADAKTELLNKATKAAQTACQLDPENGSYFKTLGIAQYRLGKYQEALIAISRSHDLNGGLPADIAFLAMIHHQLGNTLQAEQSLTTLQTLMSSARWKNNAQADSFFNEAKQLLEKTSETPTSLETTSEQEKAEVSVTDD